MNNEHKIINKKDGFTMIENCILRNPKLSINARLLYGILVSYSFGRGNCYPGQKRLAWEMNLSTREVRDLLCELKGWGLITWKMLEFNKTNTYTIQKIQGYIKREFEKDQKDMISELRSPELFGKRTKEEQKKKRNDLNDLQKRMIIKGRTGSQVLV